MASAKDCHTLTSFYEKLYKAKYSKAPELNRVKARWDFDSMLQSMTMKDIKELIEYYFTCPSPNLHDLQWFFWNYDKLIKGQREVLVDAEHRRKLMEESKIRAENWRASGKQGIANA